MQKLNGHQLTGYRADDKREFVDVRIGANNRVVPCAHAVAGFQLSLLRLNNLLNRVVPPSQTHARHAGLGKLCSFDVLTMHEFYVHTNPNMT